MSHDQNQPLRPAGFSVTPTGRYQPDFSERGMRSYYPSFHINRIEDFRPHIPGDQLPYRKTVTEFMFVTQGSTVRAKGIDEHEVVANSFFFVPVLQIRTARYISDDIRGFFCHFDIGIFKKCFLQNDVLNEFSFLQYIGNPFIRVPNEAILHIVHLVERLEAEYRHDNPNEFKLLSTNMYDFSLPMDIQTANVIDGLREACDIFEPAGVTMLLEPLSDAPQLFLRTSKQTYLLCRAINRDCCKILFDMYHLQKNEGRLLYHMGLFWDEIGYFQIGDEPGRFELGTGEINYKNILRHIYEKLKSTDREFILGMEHYNAQPGREGELAVIEAYK